MTMQYAETQQTWNKIAELYEKKFMDLEVYDHTYHKFCGLIPREDGPILEVGCGPGNITQEVMRIMPKVRFLATDVSQNMVDLAAKNNPGIETRVMDCRDILSLGQKYDGIICGFTAPYLNKEDLEELISNSASLLNEKGIFYLSFVDGDYADSGYITGSTGERTLFHYYDFETIQNWFKAHGLQLVGRSEVEYENGKGGMELHVVVQGIKGRLA